MHATQESTLIATGAQLQEPVEQVSALRELTTLELALVGGGIAAVAFV
jgi:hypothetical protein